MSHQNLGRRVFLVACALSLIVSGLTGPPASAAAARPALQVEPGPAGTQIWVEVALADGERSRTLLRETSAAVTPRVTGGDPGGSANRRVKSSTSLPNSRLAERGGGGEGRAWRQGSR